jgi:DNA polymerase elongation subunit (family B)
MKQQLLLLEIEFPISWLTGKTFIIYLLSGKGTKNFENAEDPIEVLMKDLPIDFDYYINKQLK